MADDDEEVGPGADESASIPPQPNGQAVPAAAARIALATLETPTLTKAELSELLFDRLGLNKRESKDMVDAFFDLIHCTLVDGRDVKMSGYGNFSIRRKAPRPGRNPRTGETIPIKARNVVTFHASHKLKGVVQAGVAGPSTEAE